MHDSDRKLDALVYALGWLTIISYLWLVVGWLAYMARLAGKLTFIPDTWWPTPEVHLLFLAVAKLMVFGLFLSWLGVVLYRRRLRRP